MRHSLQVATICPNGCGAIVEDAWRHCSACGRAKREDDKRAPPDKSDAELRLLREVEKAARRNQAAWAADRFNQAEAEGAEMLLEDALAALGRARGERKEKP